MWTGGYDKEEKAAKAYDLAALKYWGPSTTINFPVSFSPTLHPHIQRCGRPNAGLAIIVRGKECFPHRLTCKHLVCTSCRQVGSSFIPPTDVRVHLFATVEHIRDRVGRDEEHVPSGIRCFLEKVNLGARVSLFRSETLSDWLHSIDTFHDFTAVSYYGWYYGLAVEVRWSGRIPGRILSRFQRLM